MREPPVHRAPGRSATTLTRTLPVAALLLALLPAGCDHVDTLAVLHNGYAPETPHLPTVIAAFWQTVDFVPEGASPLAPGASTTPQAAVPSSENTAYALLALDYDPAGSAAPLRIVPLKSHAGFAVAFGETVDIPVDDAHFDGLCGSGQPLAQADADDLVQNVFASEFAGRTYDAATCTASAPPASIPDGGP